MKTFYTYLVTCSLMVMITGCDWIQDSVGEKNTQIPVEVLIEETWQLIAFADKDGSIITEIERPPAESIQYTIQFSDQPSDQCVWNDDKLSSGTWCMKIIAYPNSSGSATYDLKSGDKMLKIYLNDMTLMGIPEHSREPEFIEALHFASGYSIEEDRLYISYTNNKKLIFKPLQQE